MDYLNPPQFSPNCLLPCAPPSALSGLMRTPVQNGRERRDEVVFGDGALDRKLCSAAFVEDTLDTASAQIVAAGRTC